jgi:hypothetical protein
MIDISTKILCIELEKLKKKPHFVCVSSNNITSFLSCFRNFLDLSQANTKDFLFLFLKYISLEVTDISVEVNRVTYRCLCHMDNLDSVVIDRRFAKLVAQYHLNLSEKEHI